MTLTTSRYIRPDLIIFVQLHPSCIFMSPHERSVPGSASHIVECDKGSLSRSPVAFSTKGHLAVSSIPAAEWGWVSEQIRWKLKAASKVDERINYDQLEHGILMNFVSSWVEKFSVRFGLKFCAITPSSLFKLLWISAWNWWWPKIDQRIRYSEPLSAWRVASPNMSLFDPIRIHLLVSVHWLMRPFVTSEDLPCRRKHGMVVSKTFSRF